MKIFKKSTFNFILVIISLIILVYLGKREIFPSKETLYSTALQSYKNWDNLNAKKILAELYKNYPDEIKIDSLYGNVLFRLGELLEAKVIFTKLSLKSANLKKYSELKLAHINYFLSDLNSARKKLQSVKNSAKISGDSLSLAIAYNIEGLVDFNNLNYNKALNNQRKSLLLAQRLNNKKIIADALRQIGVLYWYNSKFDSAINSFYKPALIIYRKINDKIGEATTLSDIGLVFKDLQRLEENIIYQLKAFGIRKQIGDKIGLADSYYFLSNSISMSGWKGSVIYAYTKKSYELSKEAGYKWGMEVASRALKNYYYTRHEFSPDVYTLPDSLESIGEGKIYRLWNKAKVQKGMGNLFGQIKTLQELINLDDSLKYTNGELVSLAFLASSLIELHKYNEAEKNLTRAFILRTKNHYSDFLIDTTLARLYIAEGKLKKAGNLLQDITRNSDSLYLNYISTENNKITGDNLSRIQKERSAAYSMLVDVLYSLKDKKLFKAIQKERNFTFWFRSNVFLNFNDDEVQNPFEIFVSLLDNYEKNPDKYRDVQKLTDQFETVQNNIEKINNVISKFSLIERKLPDVSIDNIQKNLNSGEVMIEYFLGLKNVYTIAIKKYGYKLLCLDTAPLVLKSQVDLYLDLINRGRNNPNDDLWKGVSHRLYQKLIEPLERDNFINENDRLIISLHKFLYNLPLQTLDINSTQVFPKFLVEKYFISYIPSPAFWLKSRKIKNGNYNSIIAVAPESKILSGTEQEINNIPGNYFMNFSILRNNEVDRKRLINSFNKFDIVHIAAHAKTNPWFPLYSYIKCYDKNLKLYEIFNSDIKTKLVILSACETGLGVSSVGGKPENEDFFSFSRAFLLKGAHSVISTFWLINDRTTAELMKLFYKNLFYKSNERVKSNPVDVALNSAQRNYIELQRKTGKSIHPFYWGAFFISGASKN